MEALEGWEDTWPKVVAKEWQDWREAAWGTWEEEDPRDKVTVEEEVLIHYDPTPTMDLRRKTCALSIACLRNLMTCRIVGAL